jgi:hypothetical protein
VKDYPVEILARLKDRRDLRRHIKYATAKRSQVNHRWEITYDDFTNRIIQTDVENDPENTTVMFGLLNI